MSTRPIHVYLAAKFSRREELRTIAKWLRDLGYAVTSRWHEGQEEDVLDSPESTEWAVRNTEDVRASDVVVSFAEVAGTPGAERGGRHAESGMAVITGKGAVLVGKPEHIFHTHPSVVVISKVGEIVGALRAYAEARNTPTSKASATEDAAWQRYLEACEKLPLEWQALMGREARLLVDGVTAELRAELELSKGCAKEGRAAVVEASRLRSPAEWMTNEDVYGSILQAAADSPVGKTPESGGAEARRLFKRIQP